MSRPPVTRRALMAALGAGGAAATVLLWTGTTA
ncbi:twin-arginine translocation signal domain-containing protein [Micromonospora sp. FIMYZ51]